MGTIAFIAFMAFLIKFSTERWWLWFVFVIGLLAKAGYQLSMIGLLVAVGLSKVLKDLCNQ
jgi:uncharacterized membrane protein YedE/YeeE